MFDHLTPSDQDFHVAARAGDPHAALRRVIARRLRDSREFHGFEQGEAAQQLDIEPDLLNAIEAEKQEPTMALLIRASLAFGVAVDFLVGLSDEDETDAATLNRFATLRHVRYLMERQAATVVDATLAELQGIAQEAAHTRDFVNASRRVVAAIDGEATISAALQATAEGRVLLGAVQTLAEIARVAREWLDRQDRLAQRAIANAAEQFSQSTTSFQPEQP